MTPDEAMNRGRGEARALRELERRISRLSDQKREPELSIARARVRAALRSGADGGPSHLEEAAHLLRMILEVKEYDFGPDPEAAAVYLAEAAEELHSIAASLLAVPEARS